MGEGMERWAEREAPRLVAAAREEALQLAKARLRDRMVAALLRAADDPRVPAAGPEQRRPAPRPAGTGLWLYGVIPADAHAPGDCTGVDGGRVELIHGGGVAALVSKVPLDRFGEDALKEQLEDMERLEALARAHEDVVNAALAAGDVVPFRLCTIFESADGLQQMLERDGAGVAAALTRLHGKAEWSVKALFDATRAAATDAPPPAATGADYLAQKVERRATAEAMGDVLDDVVAGIHARLAERAAAAVINRPQDRRLSGRDEEMLLNGAYLVGREDADGFTALVSELAQRHEADGLILESSGPWPPYHFVELPQA
jgi:hypothetical protein